MNDPGSPLTGIEDRTARWLTRLLWCAPSGVPRASLPWDHLSDFERQRLPLLLRMRPRLGLPLLIVGGLLLLGGYGAKTPGAFGLGVGLVFLAVRAYLQAWKRLGRVEVALTPTVSSVSAGDAVELVATIRHTAPSLMARVLVYATFDGAVDGEAFALEADVPGRVLRSARLGWKADVGMGRFTVGGAKLVVFDQLGLFPMAVGLPARFDVTVEPAPEPLRRFNMRESGAATDQGVLEAREVGDAVTFRGLRPWRVGDPLKRVDWRRSQRVGTLLVKEFERIASTEATVFLDLSAENHSRFGALSTYNALRDSAMTLTEWLRDHRIQTRFVSAEHAFSLGAGKDDGLWLRDTIRDLKPRYGTRLSALVETQLLEIKPDSLVVLCACAPNLQLDELWSSLIHLDERRVEVVLLLIDTGAYARAVRRELKLDEPDRPLVQSLVKETQEESRGALAAVAAKLLARTYVLGPGQTLAGAIEGRT